MTDTMLILLYGNRIRERDKRMKMILTISEDNLDDDFCKQNKEGYFHLNNEFESSGTASEPGTSMSFMGMMLSFTLKTNGIHTPLTLDTVVQRSTVYSDNDCSSYDQPLIGETIAVKARMS
jgi:hypothetical protein